MSEKEVASGAALWHGRFEASPAEELMAYTESLSFDKRLWADDIVGSKAHVSMLVSVGIMNESDGKTVLAALDEVGTEFASGAFVYESTDEDIHTAIERRVTQIAGEPGARIHTGRSRNDQVATAVRVQPAAPVSRQRRGRGGRADMALRRRGPRERQAALPLPGLQRAALPAPGSGGGCDEIPRKIQGRLGCPAESTLREAARLRSARRENGGLQPASRLHPGLGFPQ